MAQLFGSILADGKIPSFKIVEKISSNKVLHNYINIVLILKKIQQTNNVRMLAHLEDLNLPTL